MRGRKRKQQSFAGRLKLEKRSRRHLPLRRLSLREKIRPNQPILHRLKIPQL
jgi:hypothetical protein